MRHITITGSLGSGKSVVSSILKERLGLEVESIGSLLRRMAQNYGMSTNDFNKYMETHPEFDHELDNFVKSEGLKPTPKIFDSRLAWHFIPQSFKVYLYVKDEIAAERVYNDVGRINEKHENIGTALANIIQRRNSEVHRFKIQYNIDLENFSNYNLVVDTSYSSPSTIADIIIANYQNKVFSNEIWLSPYTLIPTQSSKNLSFENIPSIDNESKEFDRYPEDPIKVIVFNNKFYIYDGHKRVLNSIIKRISLLPCRLMNFKNDETLASGQAIQEYIQENCKEEDLCDWNDLKAYIKDKVDGNE